MTRAEYLEYVEEALGFVGGIAGLDNHPTEIGFGPDPAFTLRDTPEVCAALQRAHALYCLEVERILFPERMDDIARRLIDQFKAWAVDDVFAKHIVPTLSQLEPLVKV